MKTFWDTFDGLYQMGENKLRNFILDKFDEYNIKSVLDVGCGTGPIGELIKNRELSIKYKGVDYSKPMIKTAKKHLGMDFQVQDMRKLKEKDNSYDCVLLLHSLDHTDKYEKAIKEASRVSNRYVFIALWRPVLLDKENNLNSVNMMHRDDGIAWDDTHLQEYSLIKLAEAFTKAKLFIMQNVNNVLVNNKNEFNSLFILRKYEKNTSK